MSTIQDQAVKYVNFMGNDYFKGIAKETTAGQAALVTAVALLALYVAPVTALAVGTLTLVAHSLIKFEQASKSTVQKVADLFSSVANSTGESVKKACDAGKGLVKKAVN